MDNPLRCPLYASVSKVSLLFLSHNASWGSQVFLEMLIFYYKEDFLLH